MMKKIFSLLLLGTALAANAQQVQGDFDATWNKCYPWVKGANVTTASGIEPQGWHGSNVNGAGGTGANGNLVTQTTGHNGSAYAVQMQNVYVGVNILGIKIGAYAPGYLTLGTPWNASKGTGDKDGGTFGGKEFTYKPDAVSFYYKWDMTKASKASFIGYLWKGTTSQADVPAETTSLSTQNPGTVTMIDRDRNILGKTTSQGGTVTNNSTLIASFEEYVTAAASDWTEKTIAFTYKTDDTPEKINLIFCSTDYFETAVPEAANALIIDDVKLIYYHALSDLKYSGTTLTNFNENTTYYDLSSQKYSASKLAYTKKGRGATVETSYDEATALLTITVKGNDYESDNTSVTTYTVQFKLVPQELTLSEDGLESYDADTYKKVTVKRSFNKGWNTLCVPFAFQATDIHAQAKVQTFESYTDGVLNFKTKTSNVSANTPCLIWLPEAMDGFTMTGQKVVKANAGKSTKGDFTFQGTYSTTSMEGYYGVADVDGVQKILRGGANSSIKGMRAYFINNNPSSTSAFVLNMEGESTTGIIDAKGDVITDGAVYNMQGIRVADSAKNLPAGLYIMNGKKFIVK